MIISKKYFGEINGVDIYLFTLQNHLGMSVEIINYGGIIRSLIVPDSRGRMIDVVLGYNTLEEYVADPRYFGALIGRYTNRIKHGKFTIGDKKYQVSTNHMGHSLHGGKMGFNKVIWNVIENAEGLILEYFSPDGEAGFPGNVRTAVAYKLTDDNVLTLEFQAQTDKSTPLSLSSHSYFNLGGAGNQDILDHYFKIDANYITKTDKELIPTGEWIHVKKSHFDFRTAIPISHYLGNAELKKGYDQNFVLNNSKVSATIYSMLSGIKMDISTGCPGLQFYTPNFADKIKGKSEQLYSGRCAFCLEPQSFPDSPNHPNFPKTIIHPHQMYKIKSSFKFSNL